MGSNNYSAFGKYYQVLREYMYSNKKKNCEEWERDIVLVYSVLKIFYFEIFGAWKIIE